MIVAIKKKIMNNALGFVGFCKKGYLEKVDRGVSNILHQMH
jgi:hypothetical protein